MNSATIFCNDSRWLAGNPVCFGVRFDTQILPMGSWVSGLLVWKDGEVHELLDKPHTQNNQEKSWEEALAYARAVLKNEDWSTLEQSDNIL